MLLILTLLLSVSCAGWYNRTPVIIRPAPEVPADLREVRFEVILLTEAGASVPGVKVTGTSQYSTSSDVTNSEGKASLTVLSTEELPVNFEFASSFIDCTESLPKVPRSASHVRAAFRLSPLNRVRLAAIEY